MTAPDTSPPAVGLPRDDAVIVFRTSLSNVSGRLVRLGAVADDVLGRHAAGAPALEVLGQALSMSAMLGSALPQQGKIILQTRTDGVAPLIVADCAAPGRLRGYVRAQSAGTAAVPGGALPKSVLLGRGHLAITLERGSGGERYQGVVAVEHYFAGSEGLPTFVRLAVARHMSTGRGGDPQGWHWRTGGLMLQPIGSDRALETDEGWSRVKILASTLEDHEMLDPLLSPERLLIRLFHEEGVVIEGTQKLSRYCTCSREKVHGVLKSFGVRELEDMREDDGRISVTCEFCATRYAFSPGELDEVVP